MGALLHFILALALTPATAGGPAGSVTLDGRLYQPGSTAPLKDDVTFQLQILNGDKTCILYEEIQSQSTVHSDGFFNLQVGSTNPHDPKRGTNDSHNPMPLVFQNTLDIPAKGCASPYSPQPGEPRHLRIVVTPSSGVPQTMSPDLLLDSVPNALVAESLQGLAPADFARLNTVPELTQTALEDLVKGDSLLYLRANADGASLPVRSSNPSSPAAGQMWFDSSGVIKFYNGSTIQTLGVSGAGITSLTANNGLTGGTITTTGSIGLATLHGAAGAGSLVNFDVYGRITAASSLKYTDLVNGLGASPWPATCNGGFITWNSATDAFACATLAGTDVATALGYIPVNKAGDAMSGSLRVVSAVDNSVTSVMADTSGLDIANSSSAANAYAILRLGSWAGGSVASMDGNYIRSIGIGNNNVALAVGRFDSTGSTSEFLRIANSGYVGIGTTSPTGPLDVYGTNSHINVSSSGNGLQFNNAGSNYLSATNAAGTLVFQTGASTTAMTIGTSGSIRIGDSAGPASKVDIVNVPATNYGLRTQTDSTGRGIQINTTDYSFNTAGSALTLELGTGTGNTYSSVQSFTSGKASTGNLVLNPSGGNVGIGTATPANALDVVGSTRTSGNFVTSSGSVLSGNGSAATPSYGFAGDASFDTGLFRAAENTLAVTTGGVERVRIDSSGRVGIGTTTPTAALDVLSTTEPLRLMYDGSNYTSFRVSPAGNLTVYVPSGASFGTAGNTASTLNIARNNVVVGGMTTANSVFSLYGGPSAANHLTISSSGSVGIGTTSPAFPLQVVNSTATAGGYGFTAAFINNPTNSVTPARTNAAQFMAYSNDNANPTGYAAAIDARAVANNTSTTVPELTGIFSFAYLNASGGSVTNIYGVKAQAAVYSGLTSGSVGTAASVYAQAPGLNGSSVTMTKAYSLLVDSPSAAADNFAIYQNGTAKSYFGGNVGIGTTTPGFNLDVIGSIRANSSAGSEFIANGANGEAKTFLMQTGGSNRWRIGTTTSSETGSNAGTNFTIDRMDDSGTSLGTALFATRSSGNVGIGTSSPGATLDVAGNGVIRGPLSIVLPADLAYRVALNGSAGYGTVSLRSDATTQTVLITANGSSFLNGGNLGIGTTTPTYTLDVNGTARATGSVAAWSDIRVKRNVRPLDDALERILKLDGVSFEWRTDEFPDKKFKEGPDIGVIAQNVETQFPEVVETGKDGFKSVAYQKLVAPLIEAVKTLFANSQNQAARLDLLEREMLSIKAENADLKMRAELAEKALEKAQRRLDGLESRMNKKEIVSK